VQDRSLGSKHFWFNKTFFEIKQKRL